MICNKLTKDIPNTGHIFSKFILRDSEHFIGSDVILFHIQIHFSYANYNTDITHQVRNDYPLHSVIKYSQS
jgi:hypothetical protein